MTDTERIDCEVVDVRADGTLLLRIGGREQYGVLHGVRLARPDGVAELVARLRRASHPLQCDPPVGGASAETTIWYLAWRDKSGDVWEELAATLLEEGLATVQPGDFPGRDEYLAREAKGRARHLGVWAASRE
jgi:hypothetical protein